MKKFSIIVLIFGLFLITGCGNGNKVTCKGTEQRENGLVNIKIVGTLKGDDIVRIDTTTTFENENDAKVYCDDLKTVNENVQSEELKTDYSCKGKSVTVKNDSVKDSGMTKTVFVESMENNAFACE